MSEITSLSIVESVKAIFDRGVPLDNFSVMLGQPAEYDALQAGSKGAELTHTMIGNTGMSKIHWTKPADKSIRYAVLQRLFSNT